MYSSALRFTKSINLSCTLIAAVSKCFECSASFFITPNFTYPGYKLSLIIFANSCPIISSKAISISSDSSPISLSRTHPPATLMTVCLLFLASTSFRVSKIFASYSVSEIVGNLSINVLFLKTREKRRINLSYSYNFQPAVYPRRIFGDSQSMTLHGTRSCQSQSQCRHQGLRHLDCTPLSSLLGSAYRCSRAH